MIGAPDQQMRLSGTNLERAGDHNQRVTLHAIRVNGPITRAELHGEFRLIRWSPTRAVPKASDDAVATPATARCAF